MIASKHRFHGYVSLTRVYRQGKIVRSSNYSIKYMPNSKRRTYRLAVVVSRKVAKNAVDRNRIRRKLYEAFRQISAETPAYDYVINVYSDKVINQQGKELEAELTRLLKKIAEPDQANR